MYKMIATAFTVLILVIMLQSSAQAQGGKSGAVLTYDPETITWIERECHPIDSLGNFISGQNRLMISGVSKISDPFGPIKLRIFNQPEDSAEPEPFALEISGENRSESLSPYYYYGILFADERNSLQIEFTFNRIKKGKLKDYVIINIQSEDIPSLNTYGTKGKRQYFCN